MGVFSSELEETYLKGSRHLDFRENNYISTIEPELTGKLILKTEFVDF